MRAKEEFIARNVTEGVVLASKLLELHPAVRMRVIADIVSAFTDKMIERTHINKISELLERGGDFEVSLPGAKTFYSKAGKCYVSDKNPDSEDAFSEIVLREGFNEIEALGIAVLVSKKKIVSEDEKVISAKNFGEEFSSNVYNYSIQAELSSAIICGELRIRTKRDGDSYFYGGMTRKLKKLFNDKKIPQQNRSKVPIITDDGGIVWAVGFGVRDDAPKEKNGKWIAIYKKSVDSVLTERQKGLENT